MNKNNKEWIETTLGEEFEIIMGQSPASEHYNKLGKGLPFFQGKKEFTELYAKPEVWCTEATKIADKDDVLLSVRAPIGPINLAPSKCGIGRGLAAIKPNEKTKPKLIFYLLQLYKNELIKRGTGTTFQAITKPKLFSLPIRLPDSKEERDKLLDKFEKYFSLVDEAEKTIKKSVEKSGELRMSILKNGFEGKL